MQNSYDLLPAILFIGLGATLTMDVWGLLLQRALGIASLSYCLVGRWAGHMPRGVFYHTKIGSAEKISGECLLGWGLHYLIGIIYAAFLVLPLQGVWLAWLKTNPLQALGAAMALGLATVVFPFLVMQPALGFGIAASKNPKPLQARIKTLLTHGVFSVGLFVSGYAYQQLMASIK